jgi:hypothetical protein
MTTTIPEQTDRAQQSDELIEPTKPQGEEADPSFYECEEPVPES